jgi:hypothetical protein
MAASLLFLLPVMALTPIHAHTDMAHAMQRSVHAQVVAEFTSAVDRYLEIHRLLESPMSSLTLGADPEQAARARKAHREAIVAARIATPRGDIFTPRVAAYMRHQIQVAARQAYMAGDHITIAAIDRLPRLPIELEYRFVDRDLVLLDREIDLVVDVLKDALPPEPAVDWTEMCSES